MPLSSSSAIPRKRVLLVEDNQMVLRLMAETMLEAGYEVETAQSGEEGLRKLRDQGCDVVVTDRAMSAMDGESMTRAIKTSSPQLPVLMITGLPAAVIDPNLFVAVLKKPFRMKELLSLVDLALTEKVTI